MSSFHPGVNPIRLQRQEVSTMILCPICKDGTEPTNLSIVRVNDPTATLACINCGYTQTHRLVEIRGSYDPEKLNILKEGSS